MRYLLPLLLALGAAACNPNAEQARRQRESQTAIAEFEKQQPTNSRQTGMSPGCWQRWTQPMPA